MVTAYDYPSASIASAAGVDMILVGDSAANVVHGFRSTREIGMAEMLLHVKSVVRSKPGIPVVADMPYKSFKTPKVALRNAKKLLSAGANGVKLEGEKFSVVRTLSERGIKVMGHLGYLPQSDAKPRVKGREEAEAKRLLEAAEKLESSGCSWLVLELVPEAVAQKISGKLGIPTIGIGAGRHCGGQVLVFHDLLGLNPDSSFNPRFLKRYANLNAEAIAAVKKYASEVRLGKFPGKKNAY